MFLFKTQLSPSPLDLKIFSWLYGYCTYKLVLLKLTRRNMFNMGKVQQLKGSKNPHGSIKGITTHATLPVKAVIITSLQRT